MSKSWLELLKQSSNQKQSDNSDDGIIKRISKRTNSKTNRSTYGLPRLYWLLFAGFGAVSIIGAYYSASTLLIGDSITSKEGGPACDVESRKCTGLNDYKGLSCDPQSYWLVNIDKAIILEPKIRRNEIIFLKFPLNYSPNSISWQSDYILDRSTLALRYKKVIRPFGCNPDTQICGLLFNKFREGGQCDLVAPIDVLWPFFEYIAPDIPNKKI